ncbi:MAG: penicillin acylase family protein [Actinomycetota bacterium]
MTEWADMIRERAEAALPPVEGELKVEGLERPVEVIRDRWGVPHVFAENLHDLSFAQGFVIASERLFQLDFMLRLSNGRLSELVADMGLHLDRFFRTVGFNRASTRIAAAYDERDLELVRANTAGLRAWLDHMPAKPVEYEILGVEPAFPEGEDLVTYGAAGSVFMAWILSTNWDAELLRFEIAQRLGHELMLELFPTVETPPAVVVAGKLGGDASSRRALEILKTAPLTPKGVGSNNWVVAGSRTVSGKPLLANDPHLSVAVPSIWFEIHLSCPEYEASGVSLPFSPGVVIGHTSRHAWGFTNVGGDTQDLYLERLNEDRTQALYNDVWEPTTVHREEIHVRGRTEPEVVEVVETRHGPVMDSYMIGVLSPQLIQGGITETFALRWTGAERAIKPDTLVRMGQARNFRDFREALRTWECPGQNIVYADVDGHIGYQCTGLYPIRRKGDGTLPSPGWTDDHEWDGWVPFEDLPWSEDPDEGFLATANQKIHGDEYPYLIGKDFLPPYRARRISELITETAKHSQETFGRIHMDTMSIPAREIVPLLLEVAPADDRQKEVLHQLEGWDGDLAPDSTAACIYEVWCKHIGAEILLPKLGQELFDHFHGRRQWTNGFQYQVLPSLLRFPTATWFGAEGREGRDELLRRALNRAIEELTGSLGEDVSAWRWGALHKVRFVHQLAMIPDLAEMFTPGIVDIGGDEQTVLASLFEPGFGYDAEVVPSWRHIIDLSDIEASVGVHTVGQSGHPASPHFRDFVELWSKGEYHPLPYSRARVEEAAEHTLRLAP